MKEDTDPVRKPNRLINEKSPYLLEHAYNPVDWYPWGEEAFKKARTENKPIFLSIGYSSCHWCHVFRKESFEDEDIAKILNDNFVSIKVDREERPDIDEIYMKSVMSMTGSGGWPLNVFLTPNLEPFYGGTYFPPTPRHGLPGFATLLGNITNSWKSDRKNIADSAVQMKNALVSMYTMQSADNQKINESVFKDCFEELAASFDEKYGGFGHAPKFPTPTNLFFLLRYYKSSGSKLALGMVETTLDALSAGGIRDQLGGGFHRYSTDRIWLVPHFEKMLYDNALLVIAFLEAYLVTRKKEFAFVAADTLSWVVREMTSTEGGFFSAQDADSSEGEGIFYVWNEHQVEEAIGREELSDLVVKYYSITNEGNFEDGKSILTAKSLERFSKESGKSTGEIEKLLATARSALLAYRNKRPRPATDDKILTSWNGLMISAFSQAYKILGDEEYLRAARRAADFILSNMMIGDPKNPKLLRRYREGQGKGNGFLEDYSFFINGLLDLYEASFDPKYLVEAMTLCESMLALFWDQKNGGFFQSEVSPDLIARPKESYDGATPSGNSMAALVCFKLSEFLAKDVLRDFGERTMKAFWRETEQQPTSFTQMLVSLSFILGHPKEIVVSGDISSDDTRELITTLRRQFLPQSVTIFANPKLEGVTPLVNERLYRPGEEAKIFVCSNFACKLPVIDPEGLNLALKD